MKHLDDDAMHDAFMVAHEIGHSLGSGKHNIDIVNFDSLYINISIVQRVLMFCALCTLGL